MKRINKVFALSLTALCLVGCKEKDRKQLEVTPEVASTRLEKIIKKNYDGVDLPDMDTRFEYSEQYAFTSFEGDPGNITENYVVEYNKKEQTIYVVSDIVISEPDADPIEDHAHTLLINVGNNKVKEVFFNSETYIEGTASDITAGYYDTFEEIVDGFFEEFYQGTLGDEFNFVFDVNGPFDSDEYEDGATYEYYYGSDNEDSVYVYEKDVCDSDNYEAMVIYEDNILKYAKENSVIRDSDDEIVLNRTREFKYSTTLKAKIPSYKNF